MKRSSLTVLYLVASFVWAGCSRSSASQSTPSSTLTVEELVANPQSHSHTMVKVSGCYVRMFEVSVLQPCGRKPDGGVIWVESAGNVEMIEKVREMEKLRMNPLAEKFLFVYDKRRDLRAWQKLEASMSKPSGVVLLGQFETEAQVPEPMKLGFGHLGAYTHELILVDVLSNENPPKRELFPFVKPRAVQIPLIGMWLGAKSQIPITPFLRTWRPEPRDLQKQLEFLRATSSFGAAGPGSAGRIV